MCWAGLLMLYTNCGIVHLLQSAIGTTIRSSDKGHFRLRLAGEPSFLQTAPLLSPLDRPYTHRNGGSPPVGGESPQDRRRRDSLGP